MWHKADVTAAMNNLCYFERKADMGEGLANFRE
jgi:hypothetical protein